MEPTLRRRRMGKDKKATKKTPGIKDLVQPPKGRDVIGGTTPTRFDPYKNFKFRV